MTDHTPINTPANSKTLELSTPNLAPSKKAVIQAKETERFNSVMKKINLLEKKIRSNYEIGDIRVRTTNRISQLIWKRVDFLEFDKQWWSSMSPNSIESKLDLRFFSESPVSKKRAIYPEGRGFLYCSYKCVGAKNQEKLILIEKYPILMASGRSRKKILKALNMLSKILSCSKELKNISLLLHLSWQTGV